MTFLRALACLLAFTIGLAAPALSQNNNSGSIAGTVHDPTGALVPGATVTVTNDQGFSQTVTSDDQGNYVVPVPPGTYKVAVAEQGFKTLEITSIVVVAGQVQRADASIEVLGATASVNVVGEKAAQVETENAEVSGTITQEEVTSIGLNGRNFTQLITLAPGVSNQTGQDEALVGVKGSVKYSVNGGRVEYNNFDVDGSDVLNAGVNGSQSTLVVYPSLDAIQEIKVLTSNYGAQYGRSASGTVLVTTKSGSDHFHGDVYEFARNEIFNARNFFDIGPRTPLYRRHDFGFTLGGPLFIPGFYNTKRDKTFFFYSEEFRLEKTPQEFNQGVPSIEERNGNFGDVCPFAPSGVEVFFQRTVFPDCPASGTTGVGTFLFTCPGNQLTLNSFLPECKLDPNAVAILNTGIIPAPNSNIGCNSTIASCYDIAPSLPTYWREELFRIDHNFSNNVKGTFRYIHDAWNTTTAISQWGFIQNSFPTVENYFTGPGLDVVAHLTQIFSPTLVSDLMFSFTTNHITLTDKNGPAATWQRPSDLSMGSLFPCTAPNPANCFGGKLPGIVVAGTNAAYGGSGFGVDPSFEPFFHNNPTYSFGDNLTKTLGKHTLQAGIQVVLAQRNEVNPAIGAATGDVQGIATFSNVNSLFTTGNAFADFLGGQIKTFQQDSAQATYYNRYTTAEPYFQDDWKVSSRLTVNLGLRLSLFGTWNERYLSGYSWEPSAFSAALAAQAAVDPSTGVLLDVPSCTNPAQPTLSTCNTIPLNVQNLDPRILNGLVQCGTDGLSKSCMKGHLFNPAPRIGFAWDPGGNGKTSIRAGYGIFYEHGTGNEANIGSLEGSAPLVLDMTESFTQGFASIGSLGAAYPLNVTSIPTKAVWPYVQQWNLGVQRELAPDVIGTVAYVGSKGTHLTAELQINQLQPVDPNQNPFAVGQPITSALCGTFDGNSFTINNAASSITISRGNPVFVNLEAACNGTTTKVPNPNSLREFAPSIGQIFSLQNVADSNYNALQFTLRRAKAPLTLELAYSYSHSIDDSSDRFDSTLVNAFDLRENRASSNFDQRNLLNISYVYDFSLLDFGRRLRNYWTGRNGQARTDSSAAPSAPSWWSRQLFEQWELSGVTTFQSGTPFSVINGGSGATGISVLDNPGVASGTGAGSYPDEVPNSHYTDPLAFGANTAAFTFGPLLGDPNNFAAPQGLTFGDAGRNALNNPSRLNFDMALLKHFKVNEGTTIEFRAEAFNIFNHTQFRVFDPDRGNQANNVISCYGGPDNVAGYVGGGTDCLVGNAFLRPIDAHRPRTIQFGLKILF